MKKSETEGGSKVLLRKRNGEHAVSLCTEPGNIAKSVYLACLDVGSIKPRAFFRLLERRSRERFSPFLFLAVLLCVPFPPPSVISGMERLRGLITCEFSFSRLPRSMADERIKVLSANKPCHSEHVLPSSFSTYYGKIIIVMH